MLKYRIFCKVQNRYRNHLLILNNGLVGKVTEGDDPILLYVFKEQDKFIVEQAIGLQDSEGRDIYEGDILYYIQEYTDNSEPLIYSVIMESKTQFSCSCDSIFGWNIENPKSYTRNIIVGNIHENSGLLLRNRAIKEE